MVREIGGRSGAYAQKTRLATTIQLVTDNSKIQRMPISKAILSSA